MPKGTINYSKSFIYKLCCNDINVKEIYVGSTTNMRRRKSEHKSDCNIEEGKSYNFNVYQFIREHGGFQNWEMVLVENYDAKDNLDLRKRERYWKDELKASLNKVSPMVTDEERKAQSKHLNKKWRENNKEYLIEKRKEYHINNIEYNTEKNKNYNKNNKEKIAIRKKQPFNCVCGSNINKGSKAKHEKSKKHIDFIENQNDLDE